MARPIDGMNWTDLHDFTAGIISNNRDSAAAGVTLDIPAAAEGTFRCICLPAGGLAPLPGASQALTGELLPVPLSGAVDGVYKPIGLWTVGPMWRFNVSGSQNTNFKDEVHAAFECITTTAGHWNHKLSWGVIKAYQPTIPAPTVITRSGEDKGTLPVLSVNSRGMSHAVTRARDADFSYPGYPVVFTEWADSPPYNQGIVAWYVWPDPSIATLGTDTPYNQVLTFDGNVTFPATLLAHGGRVIYMLDSAFAHGLNGQFLTNEQLVVTDPPGDAPPTNVIATPLTPTDTPVYSLDPELPGGYGSWGSQSFGELMLIKARGGALHVLGDVIGNNIYITRMAGVTSTGHLTNEASSTPRGLVYCVENDGAYIWSGDNVSRKINKINDQFYNRVDGNPPYGVQVRHAPWGDWVVFPNNWLYDTVTDSWWQLEDVAAYRALMVAESMASNRLLYTLDNSNTGQVGVFDRLHPASSYQYWSQPYPLTENQNIDVMECEVAITNNLSTHGKVTVQLEQQDGSYPAGTVFNFGVVSSTVQRLRIPCSASHVPHLRFKIGVEGDIAGVGPAPTLLAVRFGWRPSTTQAQAI